MTRARVRRNGFAAAAVALLLLDIFLRLVVGGPYLGATWLLLAACGVALLPFVPAQMVRPSVLLAVFPALAVGSFSILLTTVSIVGVRTGETSIRAGVIALVVALVAVGAVIQPASAAARPRWSAGRETGSVALLLAVFAFALASSWDIAYPFQARGTDWGHYLLYADEVASQEHLLIDDPLAGEDGRVFADPPAVGALYGSFLVLDGVSSWSLTSGIVVLSALTVLSVYGAVATLWGAGAGLAAAAAYAVAPIRLDPMYWHGLGTTLALLFVPLVVLALGLLFRRGGDARTVALLALCLASVGAAHATSAIVVAVLVLLAPIVDVVRHLVRARGCGRDAFRSWWRGGVVRPVLVAAVLAFLIGAGVVAHLQLQASALGRPVSYRFLGTDWLDRAAIEGYYSWQFLGVVAVALALVLSSRRLRGDPALLAVGALALSCLVVSQLWRVHVPYEYRRTVYYLAVAMVVVIGVAFLRARLRPVWVVAWILAFAYVAHLSVGLRLPQRVADVPQPREPAVIGLLELRDRLDDGDLPDSALLVSDPCLHFAVPYLVRRPTIPAFGERQVGFVDRISLARKAETILEGGPAGVRLADSMGVGYAVADPECAPDLATRLEGEVVLQNERLVVVRLPSASGSDG